MNDVRVKLKIRGIREVLKGPEVTAELARRVKRAAAVAGPGFEGIVKPHKYTGRGFVQTANDEGRKRQAEDAGILIRARDALK